jgi:hypothetical protein
MKQPLKVDYIEILKSNQDSLSTIITLGALIGKVLPRTSCASLLFTCFECDASN